MKKRVIYFCSLHSLKHKPLFLHQVHRVLPRCFLEPQDPVPSDICEYWGGGGGVVRAQGFQICVAEGHLPPAS